jgi:hypothetical protein
MPLLHVTAEAAGSSPAVSTILFIKLSEKQRYLAVDESRRFDNVFHLGIASVASVLWFVVVFNVTSFDSSQHFQQIRHSH